MGLRSLIAGAAASLLPIAAPAFAHAGFLYPIVDRSDGSGEILLEASFTDTFPVPDIALESPGWAIIAPDGTQRQFASVSVTEEATRLRAVLDQEGTYRFSSGERLGRKGEVAFVNGEYVRIGEDGTPRSALPQDARVLTSQTATVSDLYLRRGEGGAFSALPAGRLTIRPLSDPTELQPGETLEVEISFDGAPMANTPLIVHTTQAHSEGRAERTDTKGRFALPVTDEEGALILVRHIAPAPPGATTDVRSYTTTLTLRFR